MCFASWLIICSQARNGDTSRERSSSVSSEEPPTEAGGSSEKSVTSPGPQKSSYNEMLEKLAQNAADVEKRKKAPTPHVMSAAHSVVRGPESAHNSYLSYPATVLNPPLHKYSAPLDSQAPPSHGLPHFSRIDKPAAIGMADSSSRATEKELDSAGNHLLEQWTSPRKGTSTRDQVTTLSQRAMDLCIESRGHAKQNEEHIRSVLEIHDCFSGAKESFPNTLLAEHRLRLLSPLPGPAPPMNLKAPASESGNPRRMILNP